MELLILGSAAGGGFPQWNCNCDNCHGVRHNKIQARSRTQSSIAVSNDGTNWALINASPDIRQQILSNPGMQPERAKRDTGICGIVLMDSQIDHTTGLLMLREHHQPLQLYCTDMVYQDLTTGFPVLKVLEHYCGVDRRRIDLGGEGFEVTGVTDVIFHALPLSSKAPPYSPHRHDPHPGDNIGLEIIDNRSGTRVFYAPGLAEIESHLAPVMERADYLLVDGTCWTNDEMLSRGVGRKLALDMGHRPQSGAEGMIAQLARFTRPRKILIHINNTNPILDEQSPARQTLNEASIDVAHDGLRLEV